MPDPTTILAQAPTARPEVLGRQSSGRLRFAFVAGTAAASSGRWTIEAVQALAATGHAVDLIGPETDWAVQCSHVIPMRKLNPPLGWLRLRGELARLRPDVVVVLDAPAWRAVDFARRFGGHFALCVQTEQID